MVIATVRRIVLMTLALLATLAFPSDVLFELGCEPVAVYVQSQALCWARAMHAVELRDLSIVPPAARLASVRPLGGPRVSEKNWQGRRYRVHEQRYAVFPFASGTLVLRGARLTGRLLDAKATAADGRRVIELAAAAAQLQARAEPNTTNASPWLPSRQVTLRDVWPEDGPGRLGEPMRRTLRVEAVGVLAEQIAEIQLAIPGMSVHPGPVRLETRLAGDMVVGIREQDYLIVPRQSGDHLIPEVTVVWWDTARQVSQTAVLPAKRLRVTGLAAEGRPTPAPLADNPGPLPSRQPKRPAESDGVPSDPFGHRIVVFVLGLGLVWLGVFMFYFAKREPSSTLRRLKRACQHDEGETARDVLLAHAARRWPTNPPQTLAALADRQANPRARGALLRLERHLYGPAGSGYRLAAEFAGLAEVCRMPREALPGKAAQSDMFFEFSSERTQV